MYPKVTVCLVLLACLLVELDARHGHHHERKKERTGHHHKHGHHRDTWDSAPPATGEDKHESVCLTRREPHGSVIDALFVFDTYGVMQACRLGPYLCQSVCGAAVHMKKISWLNVREVSGCNCKHGEICIAGPKKERAICVKEHELRESAQLFKHYHKMKEAAEGTELERSEEELNEVDPRPGSGIHLDAPHLDAPHNMHINVVAKHNKHHNNGDRKHEHNNVILNNTPYKTEETQVTGVHCDSAALDQMRRRLTGWFHLLHGKDHHHHGHAHKKHRHLSVKKELRDAETGKGQCDCLKSVMWEFRQLDTDGNHKLNSTEMKVIDNNDREPCLHPYLKSCDANDDHVLSRHEWCCCFPQHDDDSPCYTKLKEIESAGKPDGYMPRCDREGFYEKEQCLSTGHNTQTCWCVTPNGSEIPGSRNFGQAHCGKRMMQRC
ncbi:hypothetical protein BaRGS_00001003 [Batillaria attramentaria]|uniref:Thyroglobulin type-1 domain-containing protein n=1 Tax=Batillaria attramentaria TaxID=370345 RepID=A0ABD0M9X7_9CAEN